MHNSTILPSVSMMDIGQASLRLEIFRCDCVYLKHWANTVPIRPFWRIYWNAEAGAEVRHKGHTYRVEPGSIIVISPFARVEQVLHNPVHTMFFHVRCGEPYDQLTEKVFCFDLNEMEDSRAREFARHLFDRQHKTSLAPGEALCAEVLVASSLSRIPADLWPAPVKDRRVRSAQSVIDAHPERKYLNASLAAAAFMSTNAFLRLFKEETGMPPQEYIMMRRIEKACIMLEHHSYSIEEIAEQCGFCDRNYFTRKFTHAKKIGPAAYRKQRKL